MTVLPVPTQTIPKSERTPARRFRLSVRALMVLVLLVGGCLGRVLYRAQPAEGSGRGDQTGLGDRRIRGRRLAALASIDR